MPKSKQPPRSSTLVLRRNVRIEATPLALHPFESLRYLDIASLSRAARARIELGYFDAGCGRQIVHAVVRRGRVVKLESDPCESQVPLSPEVRKLVETAARKLAARQPATITLPAPVATVFSAVGFTRFSGWFCIRICCFGHCLKCCLLISGRRFWSGCAIDATPFPP
jgi:hypothetical protein